MTWVTRAHLGDASALGHLMFEAVRYGAPLYSVRARTAWMPRRPAGRRWYRKLAVQKVWVARGASRKPHGVITLRADGYIDLAFVAPHMVGKGVFSALMRALLDEARADQMLFTHASLHAQPAFAAHGFGVVHREVVRRNGEGLRRALMRLN